MANAALPMALRCPSMHKYKPAELGKPTCTARLSARRVSLRCSIQASAAASHGNAATSEAKAAVLQLIEGTERGIFGITAARKSAILEAIEQLEDNNPTPEPVNDLKLVQGDWRLLWSTITILGTRRTKLGLREFVRLGDFIQSIDTDNKLAVNRVDFAVAGLGLLKGALTIRASYAPASPQRVTIALVDSTLVPDQLQRLFQKNYDLLLSIFNPAGHLDITYVDDTHRVGRDDKGNVFLLERL